MPQTLSQRHHQKRHALFAQNNNDSGKNGGINYDMEAIKLDRVRHAWPATNSEARRHSISSEESLSDCEELGANHDNYHRESALHNSFRYVGTKYFGFVKLFFL